MTKPQFWVDSCSLIEPAKGAYGFNLVPQYWDFLKLKAEEGVIACPILMFDELQGTDPKKIDELQEWAIGLKDVLFVAPDREVQAVYGQVADWITNHERYKIQHAQPFLAKGDCWLIAYARACGGRIVTFERPAPQSTKPKIPDVARQFDVTTVNLWAMLSELDFKSYLANSQ